MGNVGNGKFLKVEGDLSSYFVERDEIIRGMMLSLLSRNHILLLGPPGTAKSNLVSALCDNIVQSKYFVRLLTKFSPPEELFGPLDINGLKAGKYERILHGTLVEAHVGFVDEVFKCNAAMLNSLLTLMNERMYDNGTQRIKAPLITLVGASNETPQDESLGALYDRFMLRYYTAYVGDDDSFAHIMLNSGKPVVNPLTLQDIEVAQGEVDTVKVDKGFIMSHIIPLKRALSAEGLSVSDRRWRQSIDLLKACAWLDGRDSVDSDDMMVYSNVMWDKAEDRAKCASVVGKLVNPALGQIQEHYDTLRTHIKELCQAAQQAAQGDTDKSAVALEYHGKCNAVLKKMRMLKGGTKGDNLVKKAEKEHKEAFARAFATT